MKFIICQNTEFVMMKHYIIVLETERKGNYSIVPEGTEQAVTTCNNPLFISIFNVKERRNNFKLKLKCLLENKLYGYINIDCNVNETKLYEFPVVSKSGRETGSFSTFDIEYCSSLERPFPEGQIDISWLKKRFIIGHRGSGMNTVNFETMENTVDSVLKGTKQGVDTFEFDVQFTKENTPVIFHDFTMFVDDKIGSIEPLSKTDKGYEYSIYQFTDNEFIQSGLQDKWKTKRNTLEDFLTQIPEKYSFDIEVKSIYEEPHHVGKIPYQSRNESVNSVLEQIRKNGGNRKLFFSSFDPMTVIMLVLKQNKYPVLQLSCTEAFETMEQGLRRINALSKIHKSIGVMGFVIDCELILEFNDIITSLHKEGYILCSYGSLNCTIDKIKEQYELNVTGICTDDLAKAMTTLQP